MENEKIYLRKILLDTMDTYIKNIIGDEETIEEWNTNGLPDGYDDESLTEIAEDDVDFTDIVNVFNNLVWETIYG